MTGMSENDALELRYKPRFDQIVGDVGAVSITHEFDFGIDRGVQFMGPAAEGGRRPATHARIWFQLKGKLTRSVSPEQFAAAKVLPVQVSKAHLAFWYASAEPIYLALFVESVETFLFVDVRELVDERWGPNFFHELGADPEGDITVHLSTNAVLDKDSLRRLDGRRSMRIDGPSFRGQPLGHRFDPLRSVFESPDLELWEQLIRELLSHHGFKVQEERRVGDLTFLRGDLVQSMNWQSRAFTEIGYSSPGAPRDEAATQEISTDVALILDHAEDRTELQGADLEAVRAFVTPLPFDTDWAVFHQSTELHSKPWRAWWFGHRGIRSDGSRFHQLGMDSLSNLLLRAPLVYLDHAPRLRFDGGPSYL